MGDAPTFEFHVDADDLDSRLLVGFASPGMPSLVAVDHLVSDAEAEQVGHATVTGLPAVTPFTEGKPRRPVRLYRVDGGPAVLLCEVFLPVGVGEALADSVLGLAGEQGLEEVTTLYGVPYPHGPDEHAVFSVATEAYPDDRLAAADAAPLKGGFLDGFPGQLLARGLDTGAPGIGTLVTPAHPPGPDFDGALLLLDAVAGAYDLTVDTAELRERSEEVRRYYQEMADRMETVPDRDRMEDRMYM